MTPVTSETRDKDIINTVTPCDIHVTIMGRSMIIITNFYIYRQTLEALDHQSYCDLGFDTTLKMLCLLLTTVIVLSSGAIEGDATITVRFLF